MIKSKVIGQRLKTRQVLTLNGFHIKEEARSSQRAFVQIDKCVTEVEDLVTFPSAKLKGM
ncbi:MAG: hypothetical protein WAZ77_15185 [Candidatus Nitrosopolaris sp.]